MHIILCLFAMVPAQPPAPARSEAPAKVAKLIEQMGSKSFEEREAACCAQRGIGPNIMRRVGAL